MATDYQNYVFVLENLIDSMNKVCVDIDVINKLGQYDEKDLSKEKLDLYKFIESRTFRDLVIVLSYVVDDPNINKEDSRISNAGLNLDKLLNLLQTNFKSSRSEDRKKLNKCYDDLRKTYDELCKLPARRNLKIIRDKIGAHFDYKFVKKEELDDIDFTCKDAIEISQKVLFVLDNVRNMCSNKEELVSIKRFSDPNPKTLKTCIDGLFD